MESSNSPSIPAFQHSGIMATNTDEIAATKIQAIFRGHAARSDLETQQQSAIKIQSQFRGHRTRNQLSQKSSPVHNKSNVHPAGTEEGSAVLIQSHIRGYLTRKNLNQEADSLLSTLSTTNPKYYYTAQQREEFAATEWMENTEKINLKKAQQEQLQQQEASAVMIQKTFRGHQARKELNEIPAQKKGDKIGYYKPICKIRPRELKALRVDGHLTERIEAVHDLITEYKAHKEGAPPRWYTADEIAMHNFRNDCWVVIFNKIYDLTELIRENAQNENTALLIRPLLQFAGQDISDWFDSYSNDIKTFIDPVSNLRTPYLPFGRFIDIPPSAQPVTNWSFDVFHDDMPWWKNWKFVVGLKSEKSRQIRIVNVLTNQENVIQVASEETLEEMQRYRYLPINKQSSSYSWKYQDYTLDMTKTLDGNGIKDEEQLFEELQILDEYIPSIHIYWNDYCDEEK